MIKELTDYYIPKEILFRDEQIKKIKEIFDNFNRLSMGGNLLIQGLTGSGKTTVIKKVINKKDSYLFVSASTNRTTFKTMMALFDIKANNFESLMSKAIEGLKQNPKILIIDEINKIKDITNFFDTLNTIYRETGIPILIISNKVTIMKDMPDDARLTLFFEKINFPAYNVEELRKIVEQRLENIEDKIPKISGGALNLICAIAGKEGSARTVLNMVRKCIIKNDFSEEFINKAYEDIYLEDWKKFIKNLSITERNFLKLFLELKSTGKEINMKVLQLMVPKFSPPRITQIANSFENYGIIKSEHKNLGRGKGRFRVISFVSDEIYKKLDKLIEI